MNDLTKGKTAKVFTVYALPLIFATVLQAVFNLIDVSFIGKTGMAGGAAGVGGGGQTVYLATNAVAGLSAGATVMFGKLFGENSEKGKISQAFFSLIAVFGLALAVLTAFLVFGAEWSAKLMNTPQNALNVAVEYAKYSAIGLPFVFVYNTAMAVLRGAGFGKYPLYIMAVGVAVNLGMTYLFVNVCGFGVIGAATSTAIAEAAAAGTSVVLLLKVIKKRYGKNAFTVVKPKAEYIKKFVTLGLPIAATNVAATVSFIALTAIVGLLNGNAAVALAVHAVIIRVNGFAVLPSRATGSAVSAGVAQCMGAKEQERVPKILGLGLLICAVFAIVPLFLTLSFPQVVLQLFGATPSDEGIKYLMITAADYLFVPLGVTAFGVIEGNGKPYITMLIGAGTSLAVRIPAAYLLAKTAALGLIGIAISIPLASAAAMVSVWIFILINKAKYLPCRKSLQPQ